MAEKLVLHCRWYQSVTNFHSSCTHAKAELS